MHPGHALTVMAAAFTAGAINSIAGGGTLVSFPSLLGIGLTGQQANVTSTIALWPGSIGGFWGHRENLAGTREFALRLMPVSLLGGALGAWLMLVTPQKVFDHLVPWLILAATVLLAANDPVNKLLKKVGGHDRTSGWWMGAMVFQFIVGIYGGYFGAGIGILMLAALSLLGLTDIHQMNGLKNLLALCINGVAIFAFLLTEFLRHPGNVQWVLVGLMAVAAGLGGLFGSHMAHRVGRTTVRAGVVTIGFVLTAWYFYKTYGI
ncbi:sulfite exporter TauE/SafE family protein [Geothrix sp. 21YS21S-4]|uniref:sulfite exporter TauE/SafE family protein n=1 Tax=Geothrix sp. 21YS21S-4 TaxID=3068889 RepID=UPI0027B89584|nr:sulfite exporter TauE/SafE family protein [Geothrix sp. 21YS21S-4]